MRSIILEKKNSALTGEEKIKPCAKRRHLLYYTTVYCVLICHIITRMRTAIKYLLASQLVLFVFATICFVIDPQAFRYNAPLSYYGTIAKTFIPYTVGLLTAAYLLFRASQHIHYKKVRAIRFSVRWLAVLVVATWATPYTIVFWPHSIITNLMALLIIGMSLYVIVKVDHRLLNIALFLGIVLMFVLITLSGLYIVHVAGPAELAGSLLFIGLLFNTLKDMKEGEI